MSSSGVTQNSVTSRKFLLPPSVRKTVGDDAFNGSWVELAFAVAQSFPNVQKIATAGELSATSLLQRVGVSVIRATTQDVDGFDVRIDQAVEDGRDELDVTRQLSDPFELWAGLKRSPAHIVLGVQRKNPALDGVDALFGTGEEMSYVAQEWALLVPALNKEAENLDGIRLHELLPSRFLRTPTL